MLAGCAVLQAAAAGEAVGGGDGFEDGGWFVEVVLGEGGW